MFFKTLSLTEAPSFTTRQIRDKNVLSGAEKYRTIQMPNEAMKELHGLLIKYLRTFTFREGVSSIDGTRPKSSIRKNILQHRHNRHFYLIDIQNAYPSVKSEKLTEIICLLDPYVEKEMIRNLLKENCLTAQDGLITGAPASPDLFNTYASILLDKPLKELARKYRLIYTRYRDDLLFSSKNQIGKRKRREICRIVRMAGFNINPQKTKLYDLKKGPAIINGIGIELGGRLFIPRSFLRKAKGLIHRATTKKDISQEKIEGAMGAFWNVTSRHSDLNKTEQKLVKKYQAFKKSLV